LFQPGDALAPAARRLSAQVGRSGSGYARLLRIESDDLSKANQIPLLRIGGRLSA
jgi:hypothetical protein